MNRFHRLAIAASLSLALVGVPAISLATTPVTVTYAISGFEYAATTNVGSFAGAAVAADDYGTWQATINHDPLDSIAPTITGGSFTLSGKVRHLAGTFDSGGPITLLTNISCGKQTYSVDGTLNVGRATFHAVLTHYRFCLWGHPITYAATVTGWVTFLL